MGKGKFMHIVFVPQTWASALSSIEEIENGNSVHLALNVSVVQHLLPSEGKNVDALIIFS